MLGNTASNNPYPDLLKRCLTNCIDDEYELVPVSPQGLMTPDQLRTLAAHGIRLAKDNTFDLHQRGEGRRLISGLSRVTLSPSADPSSRNSKGEPLQTSVRHSLLITPALAMMSL